MKISVKRKILTDTFYFLCTFLFLTMSSTIAHKKIGDLDVFHYNVPVSSLTTLGFSNWLGNLAIRWYFLIQEECMQAVRLWIMLNHIVPRSRGQHHQNCLWLYLLLILVKTQLGGINFFDTAEGYGNGGICEAANSSLYSSPRIRAFSWCCSPEVWSLERGVLPRF